MDACSKYGLNIEGQSVAGTGYATDGSIVHNQWPCLIVEFKNEIGSTGAEAVFQAAAYYRAYMQRNKSRLNMKFTFPCIGLYMIGKFTVDFGQ